jgi:hypothetical protein
MDCWVGVCDRESVANADEFAEQDGGEIDDNKVHKGLLTFR